MKIKMLKLTNFNGVKAPGTIHNIVPEIAQRWIRTGIAIAFNDEQSPIQSEVLVNEEIKPELPELVLAAEETTEKEATQQSFSEMSAKALYDLCVERNLNVEQKKSKAYYIDILNAGNTEIKPEEQTENTEEII